MLRIWSKSWFPSAHASSISILFSSSIEFNLENICKFTGPLNYSRLKHLRLDGNNVTHSSMPSESVNCLRQASDIMFEWKDHSLIDESAFCCREKAWPHTWDTSTMYVKLFKLIVEICFKDAIEGMMSSQLFSNFICNISRNVYNKCSQTSIFMERKNILQWM